MLLALHGSCLRSEQWVHAMQRLASGAQLKKDSTGTGLNGVQAHGGQNGTHGEHQKTPAASSWKLMCVRGVRARVCVRCAAPAELESGLFAPPPEQPKLNGHHAAQATKSDLALFACGVRCACLLCSRAAIAPVCRCCANGSAALLLPCCAALGTKH